MDDEFLVDSLVVCIENDISSLLSTKTIITEFDFFKRFEASFSKLVSWFNLHLLVYFGSLLMKFHLHIKKLLSFFLPHKKQANSATV